MATVIKSGLKALYDVVASLSSTVSGLSSTVSGLSSAVTAATTNITGLQAQTRKISYAPKVAGNVSAADLYASVAGSPIILNPSTDVTIGANAGATPYPYTELVNAGFTVSTQDGTSDVIRLVGIGDPTTTITVLLANQQGSTFELKMTGADSGCIYYDGAQNAWRLVTSRL